MPDISGTPTQKAIFSWAVLDLGMHMEETRHNCQIIQVESFNSEKKRSWVMIRRGNKKVMNVHWKGAAEMIVAMCSNKYNRNGELQAMSHEDTTQFGAIIENMAAKSLRCIAFAHRKIGEHNAQISGKLEETGLTLLGLIGLKDPCQPGVGTAVETKQRTERIDDIRVMARSSPFDKLLMLQCLKEKGHAVAVTCDGMNDSPALKEVDVGLSMGIQGTEVAKESPDIAILDDNFISLVTVLKWERCVYNNIQKFLQFQLTVSVVALVINFVAAVSLGKVPLTAVQILWVNLIMDALGALVLAT